MISHKKCGSCVPWIILDCFDECEEIILAAMDKDLLLCVFFEKNYKLSKVL